MKAHALPRPGPAAGERFAGRSRPRVLDFTLASLATWRLTHLLAEEDGPLDAVVSLRTLAGESFAGELMDCFYCLSVWVAAPFALLLARRTREAPMVWLALSGAVCLAEQATRAPVAAILEPREPA